MNLCLQFARIVRLAPIVWVAWTSSSIATLRAADKEGFRPGPASSFSNHQKQKGVIFAAATILTEEKIKEAFDKVNPYEYGALPVLLVIENGSDETLDLERMKVSYVDARRRTVEATPARDVKFLRGPERPRPNVTGIPGLGGGARRNPLDVPEIEGRAFVARMLPPGDSAYGVFYFRTDHRAGAMLYITGIRQRPSGQELFYVEIPLEDPPN